MTILATLAVAALFAVLVAAYAVVLCRLDRRARATDRENGPLCDATAPPRPETREMAQSIDPTPTTLSAGSGAGQRRRADIPAWLRTPGGSEGGD